MAPIHHPVTLPAIPMGQTSLSHLCGLCTHSSLPRGISTHYILKDANREICTKIYLLYLKRKEGEQTTKNETIE
jgi:hypothetical protein